MQLLLNPEESVEGYVHYLPHHAVIRQDKETSKICIVYDASARSHGPALNDCLHVGPKFSQKILDILLRFRVHSIALIGDIEKAFLMISVNERNRDALCFLWVRSVTKDPLDIQVLRFSRVCFGVACSPFLLNAMVRYHIERYQYSNPELVEKLLRAIYVDDVISGADQEEDAYQFYLSYKRILREGGF